MRISDWSSDVCSSDLCACERQRLCDAFRGAEILSRRRSDRDGGRPRASGILDSRRGPRQFQRRDRRRNRRGARISSRRRGITAPHPLDRPVWSMLTGRQAYLAEGDRRAAMRIDRGYGPFGAAADRSAEAQAALDALVPDDGELWIVEGAPWPGPPGTPEGKRAERARVARSEGQCEGKEGGRTGDDRWEAVQ